MARLPITTLACVLALGDNVTPSAAAQPKEIAGNFNGVKFVVWTDRGEYSLSDAVKVFVSLENTRFEPVYVDRRMEWSGYGGGLDLEIRDDNGARVPSRVLSDVLMPPPKPGDTSILVRLDEGMFYGSSLTLDAKLFRKPGRYSIRVT